MPRRKQKILTDLELAIMKIVWEKDRATVREVYEAIRPIRPLAYNTILTVLTKLREKGIVRAHPRGKAHIYTPLVSETEAARRSITRVTEQFFSGSAHSLVAHLIETKSIDPEELTQLKQLINEKLKEDEQ